MNDTQIKLKSSPSTRIADDFLRRFESELRQSPEAFADPVDTPWGTLRFAQGSRPRLLIDGPFDTREVSRLSRPLKMAVAETLVALCRSTPSLHRLLKLSESILISGKNQNDQRVIQLPQTP